MPQHDAGPGDATQPGAAPGPAAQEPPGPDPGALATAARGAPGTRSRPPLRRVLRYPAASRPPLSRPPLSRLTLRRPTLSRLTLSRPLSRLTLRPLALSRQDGAALGIWVAAHLALLTLAWAGAWVYRATPGHAPLTGGFEHWDASLLRNIAQYGYFSPYSAANNAAFFPGYPAVLAGAHLVLRNWVLAELAVSAVAGGFAVVSLTRLAGRSQAVLYLVTAPAAIFLMVGYSESLFLALAIPAWHAAARQHWGRAAVAAGLAGLVRPDALFLIPALALMALTRPARDGRGWWLRLRDAATAGCALAGPLAYAWYLYWQTGTWLTWSRAQQAGWDLHLVTPLQAWKTSWWAAFGHPFSAAYAFEAQLELAALAVMVLAAAALLVTRQWPEAVYCGLAAVALGTQTWYQTGMRTVLVLFPVWIALARLEARWSWVRYAYLGVCAPLAAVLGLLFLSGQWAG
jgi:hypothetical protein